MPARRSVAVMFDGDQLGFREEAVLRGVSRVASEAGWHVVLSPFAVHDPPAGCEGILAPPRRYARPLFERCPVPVVSIGWARRAIGTARVLENRYEAGRVAARHLVEQGYRRFAYVGFSRQAQSYIERIDFTKELRRLGRRVGRVRTFASYTRERAWWNGVKRALGVWLDRLRGPVGVFVARAGLARALADVALARGWRVPEDMGIVAGDDVPVVSGLWPALTCVGFDYAELGRRAAEWLGRLMDGARPPERAVLLPPVLVARRSTDLLAATDPLVARALWYIDTHCTERVHWRHMEGRHSELLVPGDVASALGVGERRLQRRFRAAGRGTVREELAKARVGFARLQIERSSSPLAAVAHESGFGSVRAMGRAFRRHAGKPPSHYRGGGSARRGRAVAGTRGPR